MYFRLAAIEKSLQHFGQMTPIVVDGTGTIRKGNGTWEAARRLGWDEIAVVRHDKLDGHEAAAYSIVDNRTTDMSRFDASKLKVTLTDLVESEPELVQFTGFSEQEVANITAPTADEMEDVIVTEEADALREKWETERGQLWVIEGTKELRLLCGDSTDVEDVGKLFGGTEPQLLVCDPPYGVNYNPNWRNEAAEAGHISYAASRIGDVANDDRIDWSEAYLLFPGAVAYTWSPGGDPVILTGQALQKAGFEIRNQIVWQKPHIPISRGHYSYQHEPCWYGVRKGNKSHWCGDKMASTVWRISLDKNCEGGHSTQKPLECMARPIRNHAIETVYDPFVGSGTTLVACHNLQRAGFAMEISPEYCGVVLERLSKLGLNCRRGD